VKSLTRIPRVSLDRGREREREREGPRPQLPVDIEICISALMRAIRSIMRILVPRIRRRTTGTARPSTSKRTLIGWSLKENVPRPAMISMVSATSAIALVIINLHRDFRAAGASQMSASSPSVHRLSDPAGSGWPAKC